MFIILQLYKIANKLQLFWNLFLLVDWDSRGCQKLIASKYIAINCNQLIDLSLFTIITNWSPITNYLPINWCCNSHAADKTGKKHTSRCGKLVEENRHHGLSCARSAWRFSRHHNLNTLVKQALSSIKVPSILEPNGLTRTDGKRPGGITLAPWEEGKQLVWDVTCLDLLAPSRIENGSVANPGTAAEDAEELKTAKYVCLTEKGYIFRPLDFEIQGEVGPSTSTFLKNLCKKFCVFNQENRAGSFFRERLSLSRNPGRQCGQFSWNSSDENHLNEL